MTTITLFYRNATNMRQLVLFVCLLLGNVLCAQQLADRTDIDWVRVADYGGGTICGASTFTINDYAYVCMGDEGGYTTNYKRTCYRYDPKTDVWKRMADLPSTATYREAGVGFSVNGKDISLVAYTKVYMVSVIQPIPGSIILLRTYGISGQTFQELAEWGME